MKLNIFLCKLIFVLVCDLSTPASFHLFSALCHRYYLKNNMETETLCSDEDAQDLLRESQISLLQLSTMEVAAQLSMRDFEMFRNIESTEYVAVFMTLELYLYCIFLKQTSEFAVESRQKQKKKKHRRRNKLYKKLFFFEQGREIIVHSLTSVSFFHRYVDDLFKLDSSIGSGNLKQFEEVINQETFWVATEILKEPNTLKRMKTIKHFIKIALHCRECKNFNSMFAIIRWDDSRQ